MTLGTAVKITTTTVVAATSATITIRTPDGTAGTSAAVMTDDSGGVFSYIYQSTAGDVDGILQFRCRNLFRSSQHASDGTFHVTASATVQFSILFEGVEGAVLVAEPGIGGNDVGMTEVSNSTASIALLADDVRLGHSFRIDVIDALGGEIQFLENVFDVLGYGRIRKGAGRLKRH